MQVSITRTTPTFHGPTAGVFVQWTVASPPVDTALVFTLYRSDSPAGPFDVVMENLTDDHYYDAHIPSYSYEQTVAFGSLARKLYYRVEASGVASAAVPLGDMLPKRIMLLRRKMQRDLAIQLKVGAGIPFTVLPRKHWGLRCTICFDKLTKKVMDSKCSACYGTGFVDGYHYGYNTLARKGVTNIQTSVAPQGKVEINQLQITMLDYPRIEVDDLFVEVRQDRRYVVKHVTRTELRGVPVHQQLICSELARDSIEYRIPVPDSPPLQVY